MSNEKFWIAYEYDHENMTAEHVYRYNRGLMERKNPDGTWHEEREALCIFCGEDWDYEDITEEEANQIVVKY
ncbi:MAG: hypothetical protein J6I68_04515 [Butyrivibrio sp.]|uniref:hypothetical protein n=1 Tax=Butyrivibrio sp. TaxID=28121 RepID=UPI001B600169|nr:hypothetical protein [Butyrivibrio sp.]MBP3782492.1 hypothetical protein [Butyrivibrio sp.]